MQARSLMWRPMAIGWAAQIYWLSASPKLTSIRTRSYLAELLERWFGWRASPDEILLLGLIVRKCAHFTEYAVLAFLVFQSLSGLTRMKRALLCLGLTAAYALSDEVHQAFVPGRGASWVDWAIDTAGAACMVYLLAVRFWSNQPSGTAAVACGDSALSKPPAPTEVAE